MAQKLVVFGDINGSISAFLATVSKLHAKNDFAFAIVAGNLFADPRKASTSDVQDVTKLLQGELEISLPIYFALGNRPLPEAVIEKLAASSGEVCPNLSILGRKVFFKSLDGFKIVAIGGTHVPPADGVLEPYSAVYRDSDVEAAKGFADADLLITTDWPADIAFGSRNFTDFSPAPTTSDSLASLCATLKPRYHFSASSAFFEREPFFHGGPAPRSVTRFISVAPFRNSNKQKWVYAFSLEPGAPAPESLPPGTTATPFSTAKKRRLESQEDTFDALGFDRSYSQSSGHRDNRNSRSKRQKAAPPPTQGQCYFCLSNPSFETHMVGSIGTDSFLATAKGPLSKKDTFPDLGFPCHMLILPLTHAPTMATIPESERASSLREMKQYRDALCKMVAAQSKDANGNARLGGVTWEVSRSRGVHLHWQFLPISVDQIENGIVEAGFEVEAENLSYPKFVKTVPEIEEAERGEYFKVMLWTENMQREIVLPLESSFYFNLQFGRVVMAKLLGLENRTKWQECEQSKLEEEADKDAFRLAFKTFDFTLEG